MYEAAIIGGGVVGGLIARQLSAYEGKICILEKENDVSMGASKANSGIVHAGYDPVPGTLKAKLNVEGSKMMDRVTSELGVKYKRNGTLVVGFNEADDSNIRELYERGLNNGVEDLKIISGEKVREMENNLSEEISSALYAPTGAIVCPYQLTIASVGNAMDNGCDLKLNFNVSEISKEGENYEIHSTGGETVITKYIINCAGIYADRIAAMVGDTSFSIFPRVGEYMLMDKECKDLVSMTVFKIPNKMGKGVLVTKTVDGNVLCGPTSEDRDIKDNTQTTQKGIEFIKEKEMEFFNEMPWDKVITSFAGVRAKGSTKDFVINCPTEHFINVAAIDSPGLSSSPAIAIYVENMLLGMDFNSNRKENYDGTRRSTEYFREMPLQDKQEFIKEHPAFGRVVCRCEEVTEGEIIDAIHRNPGARDTDGIKRRTRTGMGRCQGGFCLPTVVEILSRELNVGIEAVTKLGGRSQINYTKTKGGDYRG